MQGGIECMYLQYFIGWGEVAGEHRVQYHPCVSGVGSCLKMKEEGYYVGINKIKP